MGAYSYPVVGEVERFSRLKMQNSDPVYFAGEAFSAPSERGTVSGAIDSGERTAKLLLKRFGLSAQRDEMSHVG